MLHWFREHAHACQLFEFRRNQSSLKQHKMAHTNHLTSTGNCLFLILFSFYRLKLSILLLYSLFASFLHIVHLQCSLEKPRIKNYYLHIIWYSRVRFHWSSRSSIHNHSALFFTIKISSSYSFSTIVASVLFFLLAVESSHRFSMPDRLSC